MSWLRKIWNALKRADRSVLLILLVALALRVAFGIALPLDGMSDDAGFYLNYARLFAEGHPLLALPDGDSGGYTYRTSVGPLYPVFLALFVRTLPEGAALIGVRVVQTALDILSVWLVYRIGVRLFGRQAGLVAMMAIALDLRFALQAPDPTTETLYITLTLAGFATYVTAAQSERSWGFVWSGMLFGLATLTRPVPFLLPLALVFHALLAKESRPRLLKGVGVMALALWAAVAPWVIRNAVVTGGQFIPVSNVGASTFWLGSTDDGQYHGHQDFYQVRDEDIGMRPQETETGQTMSAEYVQAGLSNVLENPLDYLVKRAGNTMETYLQPYGTVWFGGEGSIKQTTASWLRGEASLRDVLASDAFWPKLVIYSFHFTSVGFGLAGLALSWRRWREVLPLALILAYGTAIYAVLIVIPRYLFPLMPFFWVAAGYALVRLWKWVRRRGKRIEHAIAPQPDQA